MLYIKWTEDIFMLSYDTTICTCNEIISHIIRVGSERENKEGLVSHKNVFSILVPAPATVKPNSTGMNTLFDGLIGFCT